ncbi:hypothetical protein KUTeg_009185 [Tegillarca granosa]|uniref:Uncharacterized protein n=1 Tax=Tegillarca granosa TaxID=220873 RepID=A0ABQ9F7B9_TEGGR|nr:hypothetical protein KUTeg_009185 [Tegillarca granosa]
MTTYTNIPQLILMNKIDCFCQASEKKLQDIFYSQKVKQGVKKVSETIGLPEYTVLPMKNISCEQGPGIDTNISILALHNLQKMLNAADDYLSYFLPELLPDKIEVKFQSEEAIQKDNSFYYIYVKFGKIFTERQFRSCCILGFLQSDL